MITLSIASESPKTILSTSKAQGLHKLTEALSLVNLHFLVFGSSEKDDTCDKLSLELFHSYMACVMSQYILKDVASPIFK